MNDILERYASIAPTIIDAHFKTPDYCIGAAKIAVEALRYFGLTVEPLPVKVVIENAKWRKMLVEWIEAGNKAKDLTRDVTGPWANEGGYAVGIGYGPPQPGRWDGHLTALIDNQYIVDTALRQANRPQYGIEMPECAIIGLPENFMAGGRHFCGESESGTLLFYEYNDNFLFKQAPDWKREYRSEVGEIIRKINAVIPRAV